MKRVRKFSKPKRATGMLGGSGNKGVAQMSEPRQILSGSIRSAVAGARLIRKTDGAAKIDVTVVLARKNEIQRDNLHRHALTSPHERPSR
jgi:hypothetical protein